MKQYRHICTLMPALAALLLCSGCYTGRTASGGDPGATLAGAAIGGNVGGLLGGLIGESNHGGLGAWRGSAIGAITGTIAGAAIGNAASRSAVAEGEEEYVIEQAVPVKPPRSPRRRTADDMYNLRVRNIRFIDEDRDHVISPGESSKVIFDIINEGSRPVFGVVPVVEELTGTKHIRISPSLVVESIAPHSGVKYTATVMADRRIRRGEIVLRVAVGDERGELYDGQEFSLPTVR